MTSSPRALMLLLAVTLTLSAVGCATKDKHVFVSTIHQPTTLTLIDAYQNQSVWEMDIPVNHKLVLDFESDTHNPDAMGTAASWVNWELYRSDDQPTDAGRSRKGTLVRNDRIDLTGTMVRMQVNYRTAPELPGSLDAAPIPMMETPESVAQEASAEAKAMTDDTDEAMDVEPTEDADEAMEVTEEALEEAAEEVAEAAEDVAEAVEAEAVKVVEEAAEEAGEAVPEVDVTK